MAFFEAFFATYSAATILGKSTKIINHANDIFMKPYKACAIHFCARFILRWTDDKANSLRLIRLFYNH